LTVSPTRRTGMSGFTYLLSTRSIAFISELLSPG